MPSPSFESLAQALLDAGVAPRFADRLRRELEDHYRDLEREALENDWTAEAAAAEARRRLGADETIAREFLSRPELKSWIYRAQWAVTMLRSLCLIYIGVRGAGRVLAASRSAVVRFAVAGTAAAVVTASLLLAMQLSIDSGRPALVVQAPEASESRAEPRRPPGRRTGERRRAEAVTVARVEKPQRHDIVMPSMERPRVPAPSLPNVDQVLQVRPLVALEVALRPGAVPEINANDGDLLPIVKVTPQFPLMAVRRGIEGYVLIEYTVTRTGSVSDVVVVESSSEVFEKPALDAVQQFKYKPRIVDGQPVPVRGVRARMKFVLEA